MTYEGHDEEATQPTEPMQEVSADKQEAAGVDLRQKFRTDQENMAYRAAQEEYAYGLYSRDYDKKHAGTRPTLPNRGLPRLFWLFAILGGLGVLMSALRTQPVFALVATRFAEIANRAVQEGQARLQVDPNAANLEGLIAMLVVDGTAMAFRFAVIFMGGEVAQEGKVKMRWVRRGFWFSFVAQVITNLYAVSGVITVLPAEIINWLEALIAIVAALSGIVIGLATGDILAHMLLGTRGDYEAALKKYHEETAQYEEDKRAGWPKERRRYGVIVPESRPRAHRDDTGDGGRSGRSRRVQEREQEQAPRPRTRSAGTGGPSPSEQRVLQYLRERDGARELSLSQLAEAVGVSKTVAHRARQRYGQEQTPSGDRNATG